MKLRQFRDFLHKFILVSILLVNIFSFLFSDYTLAQTITPTILDCQKKAVGDANCDKTIDLLDFEMFRSEFLQFKNGQLEINSAKADFNSDMSIDLLDFEIFRQGYINSSVITQTPTASPTPTVTPITQSCTKTIPLSVNAINGTGINPGDIICLSAGNRVELAIDGIHGTAQQPVIIKNTGGKTVIAGGNGQAGIQITNSSFLRITGTGVSQKCGAEFLANQQECGVQITATRKGLEIESDNGKTTHDIEIDHIQIDNTSTIGFGTGISIKPRNGAILSNFVIHHNYIYKTENEGFYLGAAPGKPAVDQGTLANIDVSFNLIDNTGFDGLNLKQAETGTNKIYNNIITNTGLLNGQVDHVPEGGIKLVQSRADVYNNYVSNSLDTGIGSTQIPTGTTNHYYNNIIVSSKTLGIQVKDSNTYIYNNTLVNNGSGIETQSGSQVFDNIIVGPSPMSGGFGSGNITNQQAGVLFNSGEYSLKPGSPAIDMGRNTGIFPKFDYIGTLRPQGTRTDVGAYEFKSK